jgi:hypothetical protein
MTRGGMPETTVSAIWQADRQEPPPTIPERGNSSFPQWQWEAGCAHLVTYELGSGYLNLYLYGIPSSPLVGPPPRCHAGEHQTTGHVVNSCNYPQRGIVQGPQPHFYEMPTQTSEEARFNGGFWH